MAGILTLGQWLGGPDDVKVESVFPSTSRTYAYNFARNITGWTFKLDYQTIVVDSVGYSDEGVPDFKNSQVVGYFPYGTASAGLVQVIQAATGLVNVTHPAALYTGSILPDGRSFVPILVMSLSWTDNSTNPQTNTHRMAKILAWEPEVTIGNPINSAGFVALV